MATNRNSVEPVIGGNRPESILNLVPTLEAFKIIFYPHPMRPTPYLQPNSPLNELPHVGLNIVANFMAREFEIGSQNQINALGAYFPLRYLFATVTLCEKICIIRNVHTIPVTGRLHC